MKLKKIIASALVAATAICSMSFGASAAKDQEFTAFLMYADAAGNWQLFDAKSSEKGNCKVNGDGTYTVSVDISNTKAKKAADKASVFCVDILKLGKALEDAKVPCNNYTREGKDKTFKMLDDMSKVTVKVGNIKIKVDGKEVEKIDETKMYYGDIEEKGTFRIELANDYGATKGGMGVVDVEDVAPTKNIEVTFTLAGTGMGTPVTLAPAATPEPTATPNLPPAVSTTAAATDAAKTSTDSKSDDGGLSTGAIVGIVAAVVVVAGVIVFVAMKKKKED